jgi:hypothetical protein
MEIAPRPFGEVLSEGISLLGRVWRRLLAPAFWSYVLLGALTIVTLVYTGVNDFLQLILANPLVLESMSEEELFDRFVQLGNAALIGIALQLLASGFLYMTAHRLVASEMAGAPITTKEAVTWALRRYWTLIVAGVVSFLAVVAGLFLLVVPGVWLIGCFTMLTEVVALEPVGPLESLRRCLALVRGRWWPTIGFVLLVALLGSAAAQLVQFIALPALAGGDVGLVAGLAFVFLMVVQGFVSAAIGVMHTRWYIDLRARKETMLTTHLV